MNECCCQGAVSVSEARFLQPVPILQVELFWEEFYKAKKEMADKDARQ